jgi:Mce-associated membrane protein
VSDDPTLEPSESTTDTGDADAGAGSRRPSPTSRARRIGGRPSPRPAPGPGPAAAQADESVDLGESAPTPQPAPQPTPQPAPAARPVPPSEPAPVAASGGSAGRGLPVAWIPALVLGLAVLVLAVVLVIASHGVYWAKADASGSSRTERQEEVLAATKKCFAQINSYDYRHLDGLVSRDLTCTTGTFSTDLKRALTTQILKLAPKLKAVQTAQVNRAGISAVNRAGNQVVALIYGQLAQSNSTTAQKTPRLDVVGAVVTVDKVGDRWLISKVDTDVGNSLGS